MELNSAQQSRRNVSANATPLDSVAEPASVASDSTERVVSAELEQLVWQALADIPENYREPMILFYREERSVARVAEALDLSQDAVKQRLSRGRKMLHEQLAATVQAVLEDSKPSKSFSSAVVLGLSGAKAKTGLAGFGARAANASGTGVAGMFWVQFAQLPLIAWLFKTALDQTRSPRERQMMVRHLVIWMSATALFAATMFASIPWHSSISSPLVRAMVIPGMLILFYIPVVISHRQFGKRIEQLRVVNLVRFTGAD